MPLVTLLTDFGDDSPYPAEVRAVLCAPTFGPPIRVVDITHRIRRHDVRQGAYLLRAACTTFPEGTVHVAVVDPGVGTGRRALAIRSGGMVFVGPDNGLLLPAARAVGSPEIRQLLHPDLRRLHVSPTFHGRDLFAPAARWLALGFPFEAVGPRVEDPVELPLGPPDRGEGVLRGEVLVSDPFGNLATNLPGTWLVDLPERVEVVVAGRRSPARQVRTYGEAERGELVVLVGSDGFVELAVREGSALEQLGAQPGDPVVLRPAEDHPRDRDDGVLSGKQGHGREEG
ncbi:MAG: SAM-dependent chlorinase/fluorinase [Armatimonadetes bacterium]|nr:SAM-dependent chlorinase/fluorinase [Armatimonadota bacterium]MDW8154449.1 SAM-dependent chlorinase/fluorinase [Armatimonadota bacterium]